MYKTFLSNKTLTFFRTQTENRPNTATGSWCQTRNRIFSKNTQPFRVKAIPILERFAKGYSSSKYSVQFVKFNFIPVKGTRLERTTSNVDYFIVPFTITKSVFEKSVLFYCRANMRSFFALTNLQQRYHYFWNVSFPYL